MNRKSKFTLYTTETPRLSNRRATGLSLVWDKDRVIDKFWAGVLALADALVSEANRIRSNPCDRDPTVWVNLPCGYDNRQIGEALQILRQRGYGVNPTSLSGPTNSIYLSVPAIA